MVVFALAAAALLFALAGRRGSRAYRHAGAAALAGHLFTSVVVLPHLPYAWDVAIFHENALRILRGGDAAPFSAVDAFATVQALVYAVFGPDPTNVSVLNGLLAVLTPLPACYLARRLYPSLDSTDGLAVLILFLPLPFLFASLPMRDALSTLLATTLLAFVVRAVAERSAPSGLAAAPLWGTLFLLREELALLALLAAAGALLVAAARDVLGRDVSLASLAASAVPVGAAGFLLFSRVFPVDALDSRLQYRSAGGAAYLDFMRYDSWLDVLVAAPTRALYFQFAPFPLHVDSAFDLLAASSLPLVITLAVAAYASLRDVETDSAVELCLLVFYVGGVVGYGLVDSNFGTTVRHRAPFVFLLGVFGAPVLESWARSLRRRLDEGSRYRGDDHEAQQEAEKLESRPEVRPEHRRDAGED